MAGREERVRQSSTGSASLVRGPFTTGRVNNNLVSGEPGAPHLDLQYRFQGSLIKFKGDCNCMETA